MGFRKSNSRWARLSCWAPWPSFDATMKRYLRVDAKGARRWMPLGCVSEGDPGRRQRRIGDGQELLALAVVLEDRPRLDLIDPPLKGELLAGEPRPHTRVGAEALQLAEDVLLHGGGELGCHREVRIVLHHQPARRLGMREPGLHRRSV